MIQFSIGVSALQAAQQGLALAGNNLANAATPGYHRQIAQFSTLTPTQYHGQLIGTGVELSEINRVVSEQLETALTQQYGANAFVDTSVGISSQIEQTIASGDSTPSSQIEQLLNQIQALSSNPTNPAGLQSVVTSAKSVANTFNLAASDLSQIQVGLDKSIRSTIDQVNADTRQIADLNNQIGILKSQGVSTNDLEDRRSQMVNDLAKLVGVRVQTADDGRISVFAAGIQVVAGGTSIELTAATDPSGTAKITSVGSDIGLTIDSGQLGGFLSQRNQSLASYQQRFDTLAKQVIQSFNAIQSTGLGANGGFTDLRSTNSVSSPTAKLNVAGLDFPPKGGSLFVGLTDVATGKRTITEVQINPLTQSLQDVATAINSSVPQVQAMVSSQTGTLALTAFPGYTFDFTGGVEASPTTSFTAGTTTVPELSGSYTGTGNDNYTVKFLSSGTVGISSNLQAEITNQSGSVIGTVNIGAGYQVGQPITLANGINLSLKTGNVTAGDSFSTPVVANPDTAGILNALGLNTLFSGKDATSIRLNSDIVTDPSRLGTSRSGDSGDTSNLVRFTGLADSTVMNNGTQTFSQFSQQMVGDIGIELQALNQQQSTNQTLTTSISNQQQSVSGVDTNEELAKVLQYQQMFATAGKYISTVNDTVSQLLDMIR